MSMNAAGATVKDATTSAIFIPNSQRPLHVVNAWDEYCWVFSRDIEVVIKCCLAFNKQPPFGLTELPRDSNIITRLKSMANEMFIVSDRC